MEELDYWRLCEELNIVQAALLVVDENPSQSEFTERYNVNNRPKGYEAAKIAICSGLRNFIRYEAKLDAQTNSLRVDHVNASDLVLEDNEHLSVLLSRSIAGIVVPETDAGMNGNGAGFIDGTIDLYKSTVNVDSLKQWLRLKGVTTGFFFPEPLETMDFLDRSHARYAPKLAASVRAWQAVTESRKTSPKKALDKWLREHAAKFGLTNEEGKPIENAIEECSKVANWNAKGGATKTLG